MIIMVVLYIRMGLKIRSTTRFGENSNVHGESRQAQSRKSILRMLGKKYCQCYYFNMMCQVSFQNWQMDQAKFKSTIYAKLFSSATKKDLLNYSTSCSISQQLNLDTDLRIFTASVVLAFFICWAPFHTQRLLYVTWKDWQFPSDDVFHLINEKLFYISGCFYYLSSTVNPILYNVMSAKYR